MQENKIIAAILEYDDFKKLSPEQRQKLLAEERVEWRVYIPKENAEKLTDAEKKELEGFVITDKQPVKVKVYTSEDLFPKKIELPVLIDREKLEKSFKEKHRQMSRPPTPRKIFNRNFNSHKKGGR
ncbi:MAG: hypothetical protein IJ770_04600 [Alphaproteobacteria bacterium]|nr:hypothetical protein [Alphaproteobacteria bacterium]